MGRSREGLSTPGEALCDRVPCDAGQSVSSVSIADTAAAGLTDSLMPTKDTGCSFGCDEAKPMEVLPVHTQSSAKCTATAMSFSQSSSRPAIIDLCALPPNPWCCIFTHVLLCVRLGLLAQGSHDAPPAARSVQDCTLQLCYLQLCYHCQL